MGSHTSKKNTHIYVVMYLFIVLFLAMMGYFAYYVQFASIEEVNNSYNTRQENLAAKVIRGQILSSDGQVLARTVLDKNKNEIREYPFGETFSHIVGYTSMGKSGIESLANINLLTSNANISERISNEIAEQKNIGDNVITTLDVDMQIACQDAMGIYKGAIVVIEPSTGRILAMYSNPGFNPNTLKQEWDDLNAQTDTSPLINRATTGLYPPGSTFKIVTLLDFIREYSNPEDYYYNCNGHFTEGDVTINCYHGSVHGKVDLKTSFAKSCNSSFANIGSSLNARKFHNTADGLLFNKKLPTRLICANSIFSYSDSSNTEEKLHTAIGQGKTLVTPLHMALITSAIANDGVLMEPYVIDEIKSYDGVSVKKYKSNKYKNIMTNQEAETLSSYLEDVVLEGTGSKLSNLSYSVAGKTGSAEFGAQKGDSHSWFTGFSNVDNPDIVVTVIVEGAGSGSEYAVPMAKRIFDAYYSKH